VPGYEYDDDGKLVLPIIHPSCQNIVYICSEEEIPDDVDEWTCPPTIPPFPPASGSKTAGKSKIGKCSGRVTELDLIWDGDVQVRIEGQDTIPEGGLVNPGESIKMVNLSGDNDQEITIFDAVNGNEIGTSMFHISCSDSDMNSPDDCGNRQGNGKKDEDGLVNEWILDGLESSGGTSFQCTDDLPVNRGLRAGGRGVREIGAMGMGLRQRQLETKGGDCIGTRKKNKDGDCVGDDDDDTDELPIEPPPTWVLLPPDNPLCLPCRCQYPNENLYADFLDPCELPPIPAPTPKSKSKNGKCSGRITEFDLIWDGEGQVRVEGQDTIPVNGLVNPGDSIKLINLSGDNDQEVTIFDAASGNEIGISMFHISCSDPDMNSPDDCGSQQGNGKKDAGGLVNTWLLGGLKSSGGTVFDCASLPTLDPIVRRLGSEVLSNDKGSMSKSKAGGSRPDFIVKKYVVVDGALVLPPFHPSCKCSKFTCEKIDEDKAWMCPDRNDRFFPLIPSHGGGKSRGKGIGNKSKNTGLTGTGGSTSGLNGTSGSKSGRVSGPGDGDLDCSCDPDNDGRPIELPEEFCTPTTSPAPTPMEPPTPGGGTCQAPYIEWLECVTVNNCLPMDDGSDGTCIVAPDDLPADGLVPGTYCEEIFLPWFEANSDCCANCTKELDAFEECKECTSTPAPTTESPTSTPSQEVPTAAPSSEEPTPNPSLEAPTSVPTEEICSEIVLIDFESDSDGNNLDGDTCVSNEWFDDGFTLLATGCEEVPCLLDSSSVNRNKKVLGR
jgi:hypothetical protein